MKPFSSAWVVFAPLVAVSLVVPLVGLPFLFAVFSARLVGLW